MPIPNFRPGCDPTTSMTDKPKWKRWQLAAVGIVAGIILALPITYMGAYYVMLSTVRAYEPMEGLYSGQQKPRDGWLLVRFPEYSLAGHKLRWGTGHSLFGLAYQIDTKLRPKFWEPVSVAPPPIPVPPPWRCSR